MEFPQIAEFRARTHQALRFFQNLPAAKELGKAGEQSVGSAVLVWPQEFLQACKMFSLDKFPCFFRLSLRHFHLLCQRPEQARMPQFDMESVGANSVQSFYSQRDCLHISLYSSRSQKFDPALGNFTVPSPVGDTGTEYGLVVIEPLRKRGCLQLGRRYPRNGSGAVRPHHHQLPRPVHDLQHGLLRNGITGSQE